LKNILLIIALTSLLLSISASNASLTITTFIDDYLSIKYGKEFNEYVFISIKRQKLFHIKNQSIAAEYAISSAKKGVGQEMYSEKTPEGLHIVKEKIGDQLPIGAILRERVFNGQISTIYLDSTDIYDDDVTTRIIWLGGMEEGINKGGNVDTYKRYIYIHGTPEEGLIGQPASHGCIRMLNTDIIALYNSIDLNTPVLILNY
tara:strand:- start:3095 stop:3703 length:609 start_codon:yes stop_codon:yes gene_type:complete